MIRHGETEWNLQRRTQGITDTPLTERGLLQARLLSEAIKSKYTPDAVYSSPLKRASLTALEVAKALSREVIYDERLREICFGLWEGMTFSELALKYPEEYKTWRENPQACKLSGAETITDVMNRGDSFLQDMLQQYENSTVLVVGHTVPIKMMIISALHLPQEHIHSFRLDNASISILDISPQRAELRLLNDVCHLPGEDN
ncbi:MAG: histidine phosphatase family protein [Christensenellales bacterium]